MNRYFLDYDKSKEIYESCKQDIKFKQCYNNVFNVVTNYISKFRNGEWQVAYGYVETMAGIYCRHCFIIDENNKVIDHTIHTNTDPNYRRTYLLLKAFDDVNEYLNAIESDNYMPALDNYLKEETKQAYRTAENNGYVLIN